MVAKRRSPILGPDGQPIEVPLLTGEIAAPERVGARAIVYYSEASGLTPTRLAEIMKSANMGHAKPYLTLAYEMEERYLHYASQLQTRRLALEGGSVSVSAPKGVDAKAVDLVESLVADPMFADMTLALQDATGKSYSVVEPVWEFEAQALRPVKYQHRDARFFRYDEIAQERLCLLEDSGLPGEEIKAPYFVKHEPFLRAGVPIRRGSARSAAWAFVMQTFALQDWAAFAEIYGIPFRVGKYHSSATDRDKATLLRAVRSIANDAAAIIPEATAIEFIETNGSRGEAVFGSLIDYLDRKVSLILLGQTMTSEVSKSGGSLAQAKVQENVRADIVRFDLKRTAATINRDLVRPFVAMNLGPQDVYPIVEMELPENEDLAALAAFLDKAVPLGLHVGQKYVRGRASIPEPEPDEELLESPRAAGAQEKQPAADGGAAAAPGTPPAKKNKNAGLSAVGCACPNCGGETSRLAADDPTGITALDDTEALVDDALSDWTEIRDPLLAGLLAAIGEATNFEDALAKLAEAKIDSGPLLEALAKATAKSRGLGDVRD
jgi:phage gp29-like protein